MSDKITFQTNIPVELALQYLEGKPLDSQFGGVQHLFSTIDNRVFFVSERVGNIISDQIKKLGVQKGEQIQICKAEVTQSRGRKGIQWIVRKAGCTAGEQPDGTFVVPAAPSDLERQLQQSIAAATNGKPSASAVTPAPGKAAVQIEQPLSNGNGNNPNGHGASQNGRPPDNGIRPGWPQTLLSQTSALIDVYAAALGYAGAKHGNAVKPEDVKTLLATAFINLDKGGQSC